MKKSIKEHIIVILVALVLAVAFNTTLLPFEIVIGGSSGLSIIAKHFFGIEPAFVILICYVFALIFGLVFLGKDQIKKSVLGTFLYPLFIYMTAPLVHLTKSLVLSPSEYLIVIVIGAVVSGIANGLVYRIGYNTGGSDIASCIINKYTGITVGSANLIINSLIVVSGGVIFGWTKVLYAILTLYVIGLVTDKILLGMSYCKTFYVITNKVNDIKQYIYDEFKLPVTELEAIGGYSNHGSEVLMCVVPTSDYFKLREGINLIDDKAFFIIMDAYELESRL